MPRSALFACALLLLAARPAFAQAPLAAHAGAPSAGGSRALELARRYVAAAEAGRILEDEAPTVAQYMIGRMPPPPGGDAKAREVKLAMLEAANGAVKAKLPEFLEATAAIYARTFSEKELQDIVAFYDSPSGRAFVAKGQNAAAPMAALLQSLGGVLQRDTEQRFCLKEAELCKAAATP